MNPSPIGITPMMDAYDEKVWPILGQIYTLKYVTEHMMIWYAEFPPGTFVPPHVHPAQDECLVALEGELEIVLDGKWHKAGYGDTIRMPQGIAHGIYNKSDKKAAGLFAVAPTRRLFDLFEKIQNLADPAEVVRISAQHEVDFLPPD